eukprot:1004022-Rhodomonas_salina.1
MASIRESRPSSTARLAAKAELYALPAPVGSTTLMESAGTSHTRLGSAQSSTYEPLPRIPPSPPPLAELWYGAEVGGLQD